MPTPGVVILNSAIALDNLNYHNLSAAAQDVFLQSLKLSISNATRVDINFIQNITVTVDGNPSVVPSPGKRFLQQMSTVVRFSVISPTSALSAALGESDPALFSGILSTKLAAGNQTKLHDLLQTYAKELIAGRSDSQQLGGLIVALANAEVAQITVVDQFITTSVPSLYPSNSPLTESSSSDKLFGLDMTIVVIIAIAVGVALSICVGVGLYYCCCKGSGEKDTVVPVRERFAPSAPELPQTNNIPVLRAEAVPYERNEKLIATDAAQIAVVVPELRI